MLFSASTIWMCVTFSSLALLAICFLFRSTFILARTGVRCILFCFGLVALRLCFPVEFWFTESIYCSTFLPEMRTLLMWDISLGFLLGFEIYVWHIYCAIGVIGSVIAFSRMHQERASLKSFVRVIEFQSCPDQRAAAILDRLQLERKGHVPFRVFRSSKVKGPFIYGLSQPIIVLPDCEYSDEELCYILTHEAAHYYNHDLWIKLGLSLLCALYWWNPLICYMRRQITQALELRSDLAAVEGCTERQRIDYLECILKVAHSRNYIANAVPAFAFAAGPSPVKLRFTAILEEQKPSFLWKFLVVLPVALGVIASNAFILEAAFTYLPEPEDVAGTITLTADNSFLMQRDDGGYDVYYQGEYFITIDEIDRYDPKDWHIYQTWRDAIIYEY